ncbi:MAG: ketopantoate reductase family protein [Actinomycetota bacterium]
MRYVIFGAGAIGGAIGGRLAEHDHDVVLIARGAHYEALVARGLELRSPDRTVTLTIPTVDDPAELELGDGDVVVLAVKGQDTAAALEALTPNAAPELAVVCAQNGVANERAVLRCFPNTYAMCVMLPAVHLEPGIVDAHGAPLTGILDVGRYPGGVDATAERVAIDLEASQFSSRAEPAVMRFKYQKLLMNLANAFQAACGDDPAWGDLYARARAEAIAGYEAAGIDYASDEEDAERRGELMRMRPIDGQRHLGGSSWQSLARGSGSVEADYLNGEIVLLGRLHGVPTPVNALAQRVANRMARERAAPGSVTAADLEAELTGAH